jgi:hypothetical protein
LTYNNTRIKTKLFYINCARAEIQHSVKTEKVLKTRPAATLSKTLLS